MKWIAAIVVVVALMPCCKKCSGQVDEEVEAYAWELPEAAPGFQWSAVYPMVLGVYGDMVFVDDHKKGLMALELLDGKERWAVKECSARYVAPAVHRGLVFVGCDDKTVRALDPRTGKMKWSTKLDSDLEDLVVAGDNVWALSFHNWLFQFDAGSGKKKNKWKHEDVAMLHLHHDVLYVVDWDNLSSFDAHTGDSIWETEHGYGESLNFVVSDDRIIFGEKWLQALDASTGKIVWKNKELGMPRLDGDKLYAVKGQDMVLLDPATGKELEQFPMGMEFHSVRVVDGVAYVGEGVVPDGAILAHDLAKGETLWRYRQGFFKDQPHVQDGRVVFSSVDGGLIVLGARPPETEEQKGPAKVAARVPTAAGDAVMYTVYHLGYAEHELVGVDRESGEQIWRRPVAWRQTGPAAVEGNTAYLGTSSLELLAVDVTSGEQLWSHDLTENVEGRYAEYSGRSALTIRVRPVITEGVICFVAGDLVALDLETREERWRTADVQWKQLPVIQGGKLHGYTGSSHYKGFDLQTGEKLWEFRKHYKGSDKLKSLGSSGMAMSKDTVYYSTGAGELYGLDPETGKQMWHNDAEPAGTLLRFMHDDLLLMLDERDGMLHAVTTQPRTLKWTYEIGAEAHHPVRMQDGVVYLVDVDNRLHAVQADTGEQLWVVSPDVDWRDTQVLVADRLYITLTSGDIAALDLATGTTVWKVN